MPSINHRIINFRKQFSHYGTDSDHMCPRCSHRKLHQYHHPYHLMRLFMDTLMDLASGIIYSLWNYLVNQKLSIVIILNPPYLGNLVILGLLMTMIMPRQCSQKSLGSTRVEWSRRNKKSEVEDVYHIECCGPHTE